MEIQRNAYLQQLIERKNNGMIKVITGIRRCGKSYLLFKLYYRYLVESGVDPSRILAVPLDDDEHEELRDSKLLGAYIKSRISDEDMWYVFLDEVQLCRNFETILNGLNRRENVDLYRPTKSMKAITNPIGSSCSADRIFLSSLQACRITNQASYLQN